MTNTRAGTKDEPSRISAGFTLVKAHGHNCCGGPGPHNVKFTEMNVDIYSNK